MSSNLKVNTILPSTGTSIGIGTAGGVTTVSGAASVDTNLTLGGDIIHSGDDTKIRFPSNDLITFETAGNERVRIDSEGRLLVGQTTQIQGIYGSPPPRFSVSTTTASPAIFATYSNNTYASRVDLVKSRATSVGTHTVVQAGDALGELYFGGSDGDQYQPAALVQAVVESGVGNDDMPTNLRFYTNSGSTTVTERVRITSTGRLNVGDTDMSQNVDQFSVTIAAQNAVDNVARFQSNAAASGTSESLLKVYKGAGYGGVVSGYITQGSDHGLKLYTANNGAMSERLRINSSGHITTPSNVLFAANGGQSDLTNGVFVFTNVLFQRGGSNYNNSNGYFTAPVDGIYMFMCNPYRYQDSNDSLITFQKSTNGGSSWSNYHEVRAQNNFGSDSGRGWTSLTMSTMIDLNKNDIVRIFASNRCHANGTVTVYSGMLVG